MQVDLTANKLIEFEEEIASLFKDKRIRAPIHLYHGCEDQMIEIFTKYVDEEDWVLCSWRSHYQCLLKGVNTEELTQAILEGKSIGLCFPNQKVISSAIVGGILPIGVGLAWAIKQKGEKHKVVCFMGEMTSETGIAHECLKYAQNHQLPILFVLEDNGKSVCTDTREVWKINKLTYEPDNYNGGVQLINDYMIYYKYESIYPHAGPGGARINF